MSLHFESFRAVLTHVVADIRSKTMIHSASNGSMMVIPRENKLVRCYIQLTEVSPEGGRVDRSKITPEMIFKAAQKIISPYKLEYHYCDWSAETWHVGEVALWALANSE